MACKKNCSFLPVTYLHELYSSSAKTKQKVVDKQKFPTYYNISLITSSLLALANLHGTPWTLHGPPWILHGNAMDTLDMGLHGTSMEIHKPSMDTPRTLHGHSMGLHGYSMETPWTLRTWDSMEPPWKSMNLPWNSMEGSWNLLTP